MQNSIILGLVATICFSLVDAIFFLFAEETIQQKIAELDFIDDINSELITGGISASIAIFVSSYVARQIDKKYVRLKHPVLDSIGIVVGTVIMSFIYYSFLSPEIKKVIRAKKMKKKKLDL